MFVKIFKPSIYVKAGVNVQNGDKVRLLTEGKLDKMSSPDGKVKDVWRFDLQLSDGDTKSYTMNNTTIDNLTTEWGDDSSNWVGKDLKVWVVKQLAFGKMTNVLILSPYEWKSPSLNEQEGEEEIPIIEEEK